MDDRTDAHPRRHPAEPGDPHADELELLRSELAVLRNRLSSLEARSSGCADGAERSDDVEAGSPKASRRSLLRLAGASTVGAAAAALVAGRAAADTGYTVGGATSVGDVVRQQLNGSRPGEFGFLFATHGVPLSSNATSRPAAVGIGNFDSAVSRGLYVFSLSASGIGIEAQATAPGSIAIIAGGSGVGVDATATSAAGTGLRGACDADGGIGVQGLGGSVGVQGQSSASTGIGGRFFGSAGAVLIDATAGPAVPSRTIGHTAGALQRDDADLWYCVESGTPGRWQKLAGRSSAGAFHAVTPIRVYDSRAAAPLAGALVKGQQRVLSVADGRDLATGAVIALDVVPAGATAVAVNLTITATTGSGFLSLAPGSTERLGASSINWWSDGITVANGLVVALDDERHLKVFCEGSPGCGTELVVDVQGYWR